jgi:hypothetical protein
MTTAGIARIAADILHNETSLCFSKLPRMSGMNFSSLDVVATIDVDLT